MQCLDSHCCVCQPFQFGFSKSTVESDTSSSVHRLKILQREDTGNYFGDWSLINSAGHSCHSGTDVLLLLSSLKEHNLNKIQRWEKYQQSADVTL